jgi:predicted GNAT family acetyltransferase
VAGVLDAARERGLHVLPYCSFVRHYIQQHPETIDLVAADDRPQFGLETARR